MGVSGVGSPTLNVTSIPTPKPLASAVRLTIRTPRRGVSTGDPRWPGPRRVLKGWYGALREILNRLQSPKTGNICILHYGSIYCAVYYGMTMIFVCVHRLCGYDHSFRCLKRNVCTVCKRWSQRGIDSCLLVLQAPKYNKKLAKLTNA